MINEFNSASKNSESKKSLREVLTQFIQATTDESTLYSSIAVVKSVNTKEGTISVEVVDGTIIEDVRIQQTPNGEGILIVPKVDSAIIISYTDTTTAFVSMFSEIESWTWDSGGNDGLIKINMLTSELNSRLQVLNNAIADINNLKTLISAWIPAAGDGGAALKTALTTWTTSTITRAENLDKTDYENEKIKH